MQDEIVSRLANALDAQSISAEARRAEQALNPDPMDLYFQGLACLNKGRAAPDSLAQARGFFDRALAADPDNVDALVRSAYTDVLAGTYLFVADPMTAFAGAEAKLTKALSSSPDHAVGHMWLGYLQITTKRAAEGIAESEYALALDRNPLWRTPTSDLERLTSVALKRRRPTLRRPCVSVREIRRLISGCSSRATQWPPSTTSSRRSRGIDGPL